MIKQASTNLTDVFFLLQYQYTLYIVSTYCRQNIEEIEVIHGKKVSKIPKKVTAKRIS